MQVANNLQCTSIEIALIVLQKNSESRVGCDTCGSSQVLAFCSFRLPTSVRSFELQTIICKEHQSAPTHPHPFIPYAAGGIITMLSRSAFGRQTQRALRQQWQQPASRRGLAAPASGTFQYETGTASGVKFASRDIPGPTTQLALVSQAGTRFETLPGLTIGLQSYAFKVRLIIRSAILSLLRAFLTLYDL